MKEQPEWCVHYVGMWKNDACEKDHVYVDVMRPLTDEEQTELDERQRGEYPVENPATYAMMKRLPCFSDQRSQIKTCPDQRFPTPGEIAEREEMIRKELVGYAAARTTIVNQLKARGELKRNTGGVIECPVCGGVLHFSIAGAYNGHIHGKCETEGCLSWME